MKRIFAAVSAALFMICGAANAQMTDDQIIEYVQSATASGKDENQIAQELVRRGVSRSQLERLRDSYQGQQSGSSASTSGTGESVSGRTLSSLADRDGYIDYGSQGRPDTENAYGYPDKKEVFGHSLFNGVNLTFEPNENVATPEDYRLGPGDEVVIEVWGAQRGQVKTGDLPRGKNQHKHGRPRVSQRPYDKGS